MNLLAYELKEKINRRYIFLIYLLMLATLVIYHMFRYNSDPTIYLQGFQGMQNSALIILVCMTFLSYEIFCDFQKREWRELLHINKKGMMEVIVVKDILLILMAAFAFIIVFVIELLKLMQVSLDDYQLVLSNVSRVIFMNYLLLPVTGVMIGKAAALVSRKRWTGYIWILTVLLLVCGVFERVNTALYMTVGINLDKIFQFFQFEQPNSRWVVDYLYLVPAENYRFFLFGAWIAGCCCIVCMACLKRKMLRLIVTAAFALLCVLFGFQTAHPGNCVNYNRNTGSAANKQAEFENDVLTEEMEPDFTVEKCKMNLQISDELEAEVVLILGAGNPETYHFTLYRGYQITEITDENGKKLEYDRQMDYITVYTSEDITEIHMLYHGYQQSFYSNRSGIMLPGYFAYYPQPGFRRVFLDEIVQTYTYYGFNTETDSLSEIDYEIRVAYHKPVYSNLEKGKDTFCGKTVAPTIMGGAVSGEFHKDGYYIYPENIDMSGISMDDLKVSLTRYCKILGISPEPFSALRYIIVIPSTAYIGNSWGRNVIVGDCLFIGTDQTSYSDMENLAQEIVKQYMNVMGERDVLLNVLFSFLGDAMYLEDLEPMDEGQFFSVSYNEDHIMSEAYWEMISNMVQDRMFLTLICRYGKTEVVRRTTEYLMDPDPDENSAEFMQQLYLELEE